MSIKGRAMIELKDIHTGETEIIHEENLVTNGINMLYEDTLNVKYPVYNRHFMIENVAGTNPVVYDAFGGIILFSEQLEENVDNLEFPPCDKTVAMACRGYSNITGTMLGSYNAVESGEIENGFKFVYEFATSQANGEIGSVCLIPAIAAMATYGQKCDEFSQISSTINSVRFDLANRSCAAATSETDTNSIVSGVFRCYANQKNFATIFGKLLFFDDKYIYSTPYYSLEYSTTEANKIQHISMTKEFVLEKRLVDGTTANIFDIPGGCIKPDERIIIPINEELSNITYACQYHDGFLYLFSTKQINNNDVLKIYKINIESKTVSDIISVTNLTGSTWRELTVNSNERILLHDNKMVVLTISPTNSNRSNMAIIDLLTGQYQFISLAGRDDELLTLVHGDNNYRHKPIVGKNHLFGTFLTIIDNTSRGRGLIIDLRLAAAYVCLPISQSGITYTYSNVYKKDNMNFSIGCMLYNSYYDQSKVEFNPFILMTINNLPSKVVKTKDKTMKITYILYDDKAMT